MTHTTTIDGEIAERWHLREVGLWMFLGTVVMLFAAFTSALVVRRSGTDWVDVPLPSILWANTAVLALSSLTLERARRAGASQPRGALAGIAVTLLLGAAFCAGQVEAWRDLAAAGVFLPTSPAASFFYILTGLHVVHLVAALVCLALLAAATVRPVSTGEWHYRAGMVSTFWHFLTGVWVYLLFLLQLT